MKSPKGRKPLFERLKTSLEEAIRHAKGEITLKTTVLELPDPPPEVSAQDVTRLRLDNQMSQAVFALLLNVSPKTVQSWEHGTRRPSQAGLRLIQVLRLSPAAVFSAAGLTATPASPAKKGRKATSRVKETAGSSKGKNQAV
jgi:putative transcriptional regulator